MRKSSAWALGVIALAATAGCSSSANYLYRPEQNALATMAGRPAALYQIPPESPRGDVQIAALGIAKIHLRREEDGEVRVMHVRMIVNNNDDDGPWTVDTREQIGILSGAGRSRPAFAATSTRQAPTVAIPMAEKATIDLYYPLPARMQDASEVPHFDVLWRVRTPERVVAERTSFERLQIESVPSENRYAGPWWGPGWWGGIGWYDPLWPSYGFAGAFVLPAAYATPPVVVAHPSPAPAPPRVR
jgi:hypothetical protein